MFLIVEQTPKPSNLEARLKDKKKNFKKDKKGKSKKKLKKLSKL